MQQSTECVGLPAITCYRCKALAVSASQYGVAIGSSILDTAGERDNTTIVKIQ